MMDGMPYEFVAHITSVVVTISPRHGILGPKSKARVHLWMTDEPLGRHPRIGRGVVLRSEFDMDIGDLSALPNAIRRLLDDGIITRDASLVVRKGRAPGVLGGFRQFGDRDIAAQQRMAPHVMDQLGPEQAA